MPHEEVFCVKCHKDIVLITDSSTGKLTCPSCLTRKQQVNIREEVVVKHYDPAVDNILESRENIPVSVSGKMSEEITKIEETISLADDDDDDDDKHLSSPFKEETYSHEDKYSEMNSDDQQTQNQRLCGEYQVYSFRDFLEKVKISMHHDTFAVELNISDFFKYPVPDFSDVLASVRELHKMSPDDEDKLKEIILHDQKLIVTKIKEHFRYHCDKLKYYISQMTSFKIAFSTCKLYTQTLTRRLKASKASHIPKSHQCSLNLSVSIQMISNGYTVRFTHTGHKLLDPSAYNTSDVLSFHTPLTIDFEVESPCVTAKSPLLPTPPRTKSITSSDRSDQRSDDIQELKRRKTHIDDYDTSSSESSASLIEPSEVNSIRGIPDTERVDFIKKRRDSEINVASASPEPEQSTNKVHERPTKHLYGEPGLVFDNFTDFQQYASSITHSDSFHSQVKYTRKNFGKIPHFKEALPLIEWLESYSDGNEVLLKSTFKNDVEQIKSKLKLAFNQHCKFVRSTITQFAKFELVFESSKTSGYGITISFGRPSSKSTPGQYLCPVKVIINMNVLNKTYTVKFRHHGHEIRGFYECSLEHIPPVNNGKVTDEMTLKNTFLGDDDSDVCTENNKNEGTSFAVKPNKEKSPMESNENPKGLIDEKIRFVTLLRDEMLPLLQSAVEDCDKGRGDSEKVKQLLGYLPTLFPRDLIEKFDHFLDKVKPMPIQTYGYRQGPSIRVPHDRSLTLEEKDKLMAEIVRLHRLREEQ